MPIMKSFYKLAILCLFGCSPEKKAKKLASTFVKSLSNYDSLSIPNDYKTILSNANSKINDDWIKYQEKYKDNEEKWNLFQSTYNQEIAEPYSVFKKDFDKASKDYTDKIKAELTAVYWYKECQLDKCYIYSFIDDKFDVINCNGSFKYDLHCDTLLFHDEDSTKLIVSFYYDTLYLTDIQSNCIISMTPATFEQKLYGKWDMSYLAILDFFPDGKTLHAITWGRSGFGQQNWWSYSVKRDRLYTNGLKDEESLTIKDINNIIWDKEATKRMKNPLPPNVSFLFDEENQVVTERE